MHRHRGLSHALAVLPLLGITVACHTMSPVNSPREYIAGQQPSKVWVTQTDGSVVLVEGPKMVGDTLVGFVGGEYRELPFSDVKQVVARQPAKKKTILSITAGTIATAGILWFIAGGGLGASDIPDDDEAPPN